MYHPGLTGQMFLASGKIDAMTKTANLIYFGSPDFSGEVLESIIKNKASGVNIVGVARPPAYAVCGVVTQPDKAVGRKQVLTASPVGIIAGKYDLPIFKPEKLDDANLTHLKLLTPDIFLVVSYKKIVPTSWLTTPTLGTFNIHFSLLPKYRGALPISEAIRNEERQTGVTLMVMDEQMDHGSIISQAKVTIDIDDNIETLTNKLTQAGIKLLSEYLPLLAIGKYTATPQNEVKATYTPTTKTHTRENAFIGWSVIKKALAGENAAAVHALIRSWNPDPDAWTNIDDLQVKLIQTRLNQKENRLEIELIQLPGKKPISWKNFLAGHKKALYSA